jgi:hypothetical protein
MVEDLTIRCRYAKEGCEEQFKIGELKHHSAICPYYPIACPNSGCDFIAARRLIKDHTANCEYKTEICKKGCQKVLKLSEVASHNCIAALTADIKSLKVSETLLHEEVLKQ